VRHMLDRSVVAVPAGFGSGNTPVTLGLWRRYTPDGQEVPVLTLPLHGIPRTLAANSPREASPSGKSGVGIATYSQAAQPVSDARRTVILTTPNPLHLADARVITMGTVDPYASLVGADQPLNGRPKILG